MKLKITTTPWLWNIAMENCPFIEDLWWFTYAKMLIFQFAKRFCLQAINHWHDIQIVFLPQKYALYIVGFNSPTDLEIPSCSRLVAWWTQLDFKRTPKPCTERFRSEGTRDVGWLVGPVSPAFKRGCKKARKWRLIVDMSNFGYELV
jgi:hypothetical protein